MRAVVRAHPGCGGRKRGGHENALGRSRGGFSSNLHVVTTSKGKPLYVERTPGQQHEATVVERLIPHVTGRAGVADAGYDSDRFRAQLRRRGKKPVMASHPARKRWLPKGRALYALRYRVECFVHRLKRFRAIATRYEKTAGNYLALVHLACIRMWLDSLGNPLGQ